MNEKPIVITINNLNVNPLDPEWMLCLKVAERVFEEKALMLCPKDAGAVMAIAAVVHKVRNER